LQGKLDLMFGVPAEIGGFRFVTVEIAGGMPQVIFRPLQRTQSAAQLRVTLPAAMLTRLPENRRRGSLCRSRREAAESNCAEADEGRDSRDDILISDHSVFLCFVLMGKRRALVSLL